jgi:pyrroloquinoline quinone (PQQ) biosynthesis protein C
VNERSHSSAIGAMSQTEFLYWLRLAESLGMDLEKGSRLEKLTLNQFKFAVLAEEQKCRI